MESRIRPLGSDSLAAKPIPFLAAETTSTTKDESFYYEAARTMPSERGFISNCNIDTDPAYGLAQSVLIDNLGQLQRRSVSDGIPGKHDKRGMYAAHARAPNLLKAPCSASQCHSSSTSMPIRSRYCDPTISATTLQETLRDCIRLSSSRLAGSRSLHAVPNPPQASDNSRPWVRSCAMMQLSQQDKIGAPLRSDPALCQLKPCIKQQAKSSPASPLGERQEPIIERAQSLRRTKTVNFEEHRSRESYLQPDFTTGSGSYGLNHGALSQKHCDSGKPKKVSWTCPVNFRTGKSGPADPAITRTDVHVTAITPLINVTKCLDINRLPTAPTTQIIESKTDRHEIVWDNVPSDQYDRWSSQLRDSPEGQYMAKFEVHGDPGLERVNTKLADWSATWNTPSSSVKPTIMGSLDEDSDKTQDNYSIYDENKFIVSAPPNSQRTSAAPSCYPSNPTSTPRTRMASEVEESSQVVLSESQLSSVDDSDLASDQLLVPGREGRITHAYQRRVYASTPRKLSNIEDGEVRFCGHRDSVAIAHARLLRAGVVSTEMVAHGDSVSISRKHMHAKHHAITDAQEAPQVKIGLDDDTTSMASIETAIAYAPSGAEKEQFRHDAFSIEAGD